MDLASLSEEARVVGQGPRGELAFRVVRLGERLEMALSEPQTLLEISRLIVDVATQLDCRSVVGASPLGDRLAGAAVATADNGLRFFSPDTPDDRVLILDGLLATGSRVAWKCQDVKSKGAHEVIATVVLSVVGETPIPRGPDQVIVLA